MLLRNLFILLTLGSSLLVFSQMTPTYEVSIEMRDQQNLAADVYVPSACTSCPTILIQTPYNKNAFRNGLPLGYLQNLESSPYVWVVVDWRGFYGSSSATTPPQFNRGEDGYDIIEWITEQPWSDGKVGTWGPSALGVIQYQTAREQHPAHVCAVPLVAHPQTHYKGYFYGGALEKSRLTTMDALGYGLSPIVLSNPYFNPTWQFVENNGWYPQSIQIPTLQIGGWYDHNIDRMIDWYEATRTQAQVAVRNQQWLLVGPWVHGGTGAAYVGSAVQGDLTYPNAAFESDVDARKFFEYYLLEEANNWNNTPLIKYYETGINQWATSTALSIAIANNETIYLGEGGVLQATQSTGNSTFESDPRNPTPTLGGHTLSLNLVQGPLDQTSLLSRDDLLAFSSVELPEDFTISGRVKANLAISCTQPDADIVVRLIDEYPDGRNMLINDGIRRLRFRNGYSQANEAFMTAGEVYSVEVELPFVNYTWLEGHKMKIIISGNSDSRWDVNLQNGGTMYAAGDTMVATITVHHSTTHASRIILPANNSSLSLNDVVDSSPAVIFYPNPTSGELYWNSAVTFSAIQVTDISGRVHIEKNIQEGQHVIDVVDLPKGIYFVRLMSSNSEVIHKILKN